MPEHVHKWEPLFDREHPQPWDAAEWRCECARILTHDQIAARLNATERLSAENAKYYARHTDMLALQTYLKAYASVLEGE